MKVTVFFLAAVAHASLAISQHDEAAMVINGAYNVDAEDQLLDGFAEVLWDQDELDAADDEDLTFFMDAGEHQDRHLQTAYTDPTWWRKYKKLFGRHFKRCKSQRNVAPVDGSACSKMKHGDYTCMFDDQTCPDGSVEPKIKCDCLGGDRNTKWKCEEYKACDRSGATDVCPENHPITYNPPLACTGDFNCAVGKQSCCGEDFAKYDCECKNGGFDCKNDRSCDGRVCPEPDECPVDPLNPNQEPKFGSACSMAPGKSCAYGKTCCCNNCEDETTCYCEDGKWMCATIAFDCMGPCPPEDVDGKACKADDPVVESGEFMCCDSILPVWVCSCSATSSTYSCNLENPPWFACACAAPDPIALTLAPAAAAVADTSAPVAQFIELNPSVPPPADVEGLVCEAGDADIERGEAGCCGSVLPEWVCSCDVATSKYSCDHRFPPWIVCSCAAPIAPDPLVITSAPVVSDSVPETEAPAAQFVAINPSIPPPADVEGMDCQDGDVDIERGEGGCCGSVVPEWVCSCNAATSKYSCDHRFPPWFVCSCAAPP